jgi:hypothetical protein
MTNHDRQRPVTLEHLLQLKRAERPSVEFWAHYERELRAKQLAALVEKRPWWRTVSLAGFFGGFRRYHLPLGAAAVLAVTVLSVRDYPAPAAVSVNETLPSQPEGIAREVAPELRVMPTTVTESPRAVSSSSVASVALPRMPSAEVRVETSEVVSSGSAHVQTTVAALAPTVDEPFSTAPSARLVVENFGSLQGADAVLSRHLLTPALGFESRALPAKPKPVEPLSQIKIPTGSRRSNLIASATLASTTTPVLASERSARGLSDERLYDTVSRVNARGAGVLVKF